MRLDSMFSTGYGYPKASYKREPYRDDHYPVCRLDIRLDSEFATGYGYPKTAFKREQDTDKDIRKAIFDIVRFRLLEKVAHCTIIHFFSIFGSISSAFCAMIPALFVL